MMDGAGGLKTQVNAKSPNPSSKNRLVPICRPVFTNPVHLDVNRLLGEVPALRADGEQLTDNPVCGHFLYRPLLIHEMNPKCRLLARSGEPGSMSQLDECIGLLSPVEIKLPISRNCNDSKSSRSAVVIILRDSGEGPASKGPMGN
jgi:hypothetical protein